MDNSKVDEQTIEWMNIATKKYIQTRAVKLSKAEPYEANRAE